MNKKVHMVVISTVLSKLKDFSGSHAVGMSSLSGISKQAASRRGLLSG